MRLNGRRADISWGVDPISAFPDRLRARLTPLELSSASAAALSYRRRRRSVIALSGVFLVRLMVSRNCLAKSRAAVLFGHSGPKFASFFVFWTLRADRSCANSKYRKIKISKSRFGAAHQSHIPFLPKRCSLETNDGGAPEENVPAEVLAAPNLTVVNGKSKQF